MAELSDNFKELYPEHTKFEAAKENGYDRVEQFLHWLEEQEDLEIHCGPAGSPYPQDWGPGAEAEHEQVLARYYGINVDAFHNEKDYMLERLRSTGSID